MKAAHCSCGSPGRVVRTIDHGEAVERTRACAACGRRWDTIEIAASREAMEQAYYGVKKQRRVGR